LGYLLELRQKECNTFRAYTKPIADDGEDLATFIRDGIIGIVMID